MSSTLIIIYAASLADISACSFDLKHSYHYPILTVIDNFYIDPTNPVSMFIPLSSLLPNSIYKS